MKQNYRVLGVCFVAISAFFASGSPAMASKPEPDLELGKKAFLDTCARCHGPDGKAEVPFAKRFYPRPRNLTSGVFKFRSTVSGTPPTDDDLFRTVEQGLHGSNMPDWKFVPPETRWQIVNYVKTLSPIFQDSQPEPIQTAADPGAHADKTKGRQVYEQLGCASCHGNQGRANGTSAAGLVDDWGMPVRPANLTQGWNYRGGSAPKDIMTRLLAGIDGAGMPSYTGAVTPEDAWHLAYYVQSLQEPAHWNPIADGAYINGALPSKPDDARWNSVQATDLQLRHALEPDGSWKDAPTVNLVRVQVAYNDSEIAVRLSWDDPTEDASAEAADRASLVLRPEGVNGDIVGLQVWPYQGAPELNLCTWTAGGTLSGEIVAKSFEPSVLENNPKATLSASAAYQKDGRWELVLQRPMKQSSVPGSAALEPGRLVPIAVVIWDGAVPEARAVSPWLDVRLGSVSP